MTQSEVGIAGSKYLWGIRECDLEDKPAGPAAHAVIIVSTARVEGLLDVGTSRIFGRTLLPGGEIKSLVTYLLADLEN
jgi:hypothetical protein